MTKLQIAGTFIDYPISSFTELALGNIPNHSIVNKFGEAPSGVQTTATDIKNLVYNADHITKEL